MANKPVMPKGTQVLELSYNLSDIDNVARQFWDVASGYSILAFSGEMGAGKTTFIHALCSLLGVEDAVSSPTFALINEYHFTDANSKDKIIYHLDFYRLKDTSEAINAGLEDCVSQARNGAAYCFIEWPERALDLFISPYLWISMETIDMMERKLTVTIINGAFS
jgi:tRNA threonylcarbamoyladenosine biosynthesis protein TsaE